MSYLYVPGSGDSTSELSSQQAEMLARSVTWRGKLMRQQFWSRAWKKHSWLRRLSGVTSPPSTVRSGVESLISSLRATRVSRSLPLVSVLELMTHGTSGPTSHGLSESAELGLFSSRTSPAICPSGSTRSAATFKAWATGLRRVYSARRKSAQAIAESGCSSWPTPTEDNANNAGGPARTRGAQNGGYQDVTVATQAWHSPCVADSDGRPRWDRRASPGYTRRIPVPNITAQANDLWKTPTANEDAAGRPGAKMQQQIKQQAESWATPRCADSKEGDARVQNVPTNSYLGRQAPRWTGQESQSISGPRRLNPVFVEWLMGWPLGWTDFAPVGTEWYRWQRHMLSELSRLHWQDA